MDFFSNPLSTPVGQRIDKATVHDPGTDVLELHLEICDIINETEEGAVDAVKALKKRLFSNSSWTSVLHAISVLEVCVKNCGNRFHILIAKKDFVDHFVALSLPKANAPTVLRERVLGLLQNWADSFRGRLDLVAICSAYDDLRREGVEFPAQDLDTLAPIYTPHRSIPETDPAMQRSSAPMATVEEPTHVDITTLNRPTQAPVSGSGTEPTPMSSDGTAGYGHQPTAAPSYGQMTMPATVPAAHFMPTPVAADPIAVAKLRSELDVVHHNVSVLTEMLQMMTAGQEADLDYELLTSLNTVCREMQRRIMELMATYHDENLTGDLLTANDELNAVFNSYDSYILARGSTDVEQSSADGPALPIATATPVVVGGREAAAVPTAAPLIDFGEAMPSPAAHQDLAANVEQMSIEPPAYTPMPTVVSPTAAARAPTASEFSTAPTPVAVEDDAEFDMFAASRQAGFTQPSNAYETPAETTTSISSALYRSPYSGSAAVPSSSGTSTTTGGASAASTQLQESENISQWLAANDLDNDTEVISDSAVQEIEPMTTEEFGMFLSSRTNNSKKSGTASGSAAAAASSESVERKPARRARPMMRPDADENDGLFAL